MNMEKGNAIIAFYWKETTNKGTSIVGKPIKFLGKVPNFPVTYYNVNDKLFLTILENMRDDCVLGFELLEGVNLVTIDKKSMLFMFYLNGHRVICHLS